MKLLLGMLLLAGVSSAVDLTGKWTGTLEFKGDAGELISAPVIAELQHNGKNLHGTLRSGDRQGNIQNARFKGDRIFFEVADPESDIPAKFNLTAKAGAIEGDVVRQSSNAEVHSCKIALSRANN